MAITVRRWGGLGLILVLAMLVLAACPDEPWDRPERSLPASSVLR